MRRPVRGFVRWRALAAARNCSQAQSHRSQLGTLGSASVALGVFKVAAVLTVLGGVIHYLSDRATEQRYKERMARSRRAQRRR